MQNWLFLSICWYLSIILSPSAFALNTHNSAGDFSNSLPSKPIILIRHAVAPGFGDPDNFNINIRSTQRNLSALGIKQAKAMGNTLKKIGITRAKVYSSQWFRCLETATLLDMGEVSKQPLLNSFFSDMSVEQTQISALTTWLKTQPLNTPLILVTHQVVITGLTNIFPDSGEMIILSRDNDHLNLIKRIPTPY